MANKFISSLKEVKDKLFELILFLFVMGFFLASFGIVIFQIYFFLKNGEWLPIAIADLFGTELHKVGMKGVVKIFEWLPASITLFCLGMLIIFIVPKKA
jgi:hypothetical protein